LSLGKFLGGGARRDNLSNDGVVHLTQDPDDLRSIQWHNSLLMPPKQSKLD
jgi:hypothetical protein